MNQESPIATYRERLAQVSRVLELYRDRIHVHATWLLGKSYDMTIPLANLRQEPKRFSIRQKMFKRALGIGALAAAAVAVFSRPGYENFPRAIIYLLYFIAAVAGGFVLMSWSKVPFVRFLTHEGKPGLDIGRAGPDSRNFEAFVEQVRKRICKQ